MPLITIEERDRGAGDASSKTGGDFKAVVCIDGGADYASEVSDPFSEGEEERLEWYFEAHLRQPYLNQVTAQQAAQSITTYGERLFGQVFADPKAYARYSACKSQLDGLRIEIEGSPAFHALHWEALKDPDLPRAFALDCTVVRRRRVEQALEAQVRSAPALRLLIVTARPHGAGDVAYRTISRPLVDALRRAHARVDIDILRPGTYRALDHHLQQVRSDPARGPGFYHIVHFDTHGALLEYAEVETTTSPDKYAYRRYGRGKLAPYEGQKAFVFFEGEHEQEAEADPVEASELARLLTTHQIPIAILNACQSGKQVGVSETSLGSRLIEAGVQLVVAMSYSITVSAAEVLMTSLYQQLFAGAEMAPAIRRGRHELANQKARRAYFGQTIELEDWLLPVVYENGEVKLVRREFTPEEERIYYQRQASTWKEPSTAYGFVGRDLDILEIERRLLRHNLLLVRGMGGAGKTTLLRHLGHWWQTTDFVDRVFYFGYDQQAWTRQQILHEIAKTLLGMADYHARFVPMADLAIQQSFLAEQLRGQRHLLILDNLESITGTHLAIAHGLPPIEQTALKEWLKALVGGHSLVLLGSRSGETWLAQDTFGEHVYDLPGLDPEAASMLAQRILERHHATRYRDDDDFQHLLKLLAGFPLALEVVLANLARQTPAEVLVGLQLGKGIEEGDAQSKTESILRCIDYSHSNLSPDAQNLLMCLAPFSGVLNTSMLDEYSGALRQQAELAHLPFERWAEVLQEAIDWGLLSPDPEVSVFLRLQPVLPYFLASRLNEAAQAPYKRAIEAAFRQHYEGYAKTIHRYLNSKEAQEKQIGLMISRFEYENLLAALRLALNAHASIQAVYSALSDTHDAQHDEERALALGELVLAQLDTYPADTLNAAFVLELIGVVDDIALRQLNLQRFSEAEGSYHRALALLLAERTPPLEQARRLSASIYHQLGVVAQAQHQWPQAEQYYQQALAIKIEFNDRYAQASTYHQLGRVAQEQRQWLQAEQYYQQALAIKIEFNARYAQASTYHQLGIVAQEQRQWLQAEQYYQQALTIYIEFNDRYEQAGTYHQLGTVAQMQRHWPQAEQYYQQALAIYIEFNDRYEQASTYHQLGTVAQAQRQWLQAEQYYQQALAICIEFNDRYEQAGTYHQLGMVAQAQRQWLQAEQYYQQALTIKIEFNDRYKQASTYHQLGMVAQAQRQWPQAEQYYQQALAICIEFNARYQQAGTYHQLGMVAQAQRQWLQAEQYYQQALAIYIEFNDRYEQAGTYHQLGIVAEAQRQWPQAEQYYQQALAIYIEFNDR
uniref:tetratricopeptide repeat protein n=2 Tax=unclassified Caballeronia TaxID=2646786 RepID=UPI0020295AE7